MRKQIILAIISALLIPAFNLFGQTEPWTQAQLMEPEKLASIINDPSATQPLILNIGPAGSIKNSIKVGAANDKDNLDKLKDILSKEDKTRAIVIYCGCCPFKNCPNIRPAFLLLTKMSFTNARLLNLSNNLKMDWINKGYPMNN